MTGVGAEIPAQAITASTAPPAASTAAVAAVRRPSAVERSAVTSAFFRSTPTTVAPASRARAAVAAPIPEPDPVMTYVRVMANLLLCSPFQASPHFQAMGWVHEGTPYS